MAEMNARTIAKRGAARYLNLDPDKLRGGYYSHGKQFIEDILVPPLTDTQLSTITAAAHEVIVAKRQVDGGRTPEEAASAHRRYKGVRSSLAEMVDHFFGLTDEDQGVIDSVPAP